MRLLATLAATFMLVTGVANAIPPAPTPIPHVDCPKQVLGDVIADMTEPGVSIPQGYVALDITAMRQFCKDAPAAVLCAGHKTGHALSFEQIVKVDAALRAQFTYTSDRTEFGAGDYWSNATVCGDCEDYALTLSEALAAAGQDGSDMAIMMWVPYGIAGHVTLIVMDDEGQTYEIGVSPGEEPRAFNIARPIRLAMMTMDGALKFTMLSGTELHQIGDKLILARDMKVAAAEDAPTKK